MLTMRERRIVESIRQFAAKRGKCCAGCDHWEPYNSVAGECTKSAPVAGDADRVAMLGITWTSAAIGSGHVMTPREHVCGDYQELAKAGA